MEYDEGGEGHFEMRLCPFWTAASLTSSACGSQCGGADEDIDAMEGAEEALDLEGVVSDRIPEDSVGSRGEEEPSSSCEGSTDEAGREGEGTLGGGGILRGPPEEASRSPEKKSSILIN